MNTSLISSIHSSSRARALLLLGAMTLLLILIIASLCSGAVKISPGDILNIIKGEAARESDRLILLHVRLPRTLCAALAGAALACSGAILQTVLGNPLCGPHIIGVNAGAGLLMILCTVAFPGLPGLAPVAAFIGALAAVTAVYLIACRVGASGLAVILAGVAVSGLLSALTDLLITLYPDAKVSRVDFLIGSFSGVTMKSVRFAAPYALAGLVLATASHMDIDMLALGDSVASSLGARVKLSRAFFLAVAALLAGSAISMAGLISFAGLIVPHIARAFTGYDHVFLLPLSAILGGVFCLFCDIVARTAFAPFEAPVGIVMSIIGSPFFIWLVLSRLRRDSFD